MDNSCSANFLQKPKETMNRLHDENCRRSQGGRACSVFYSPQASSGFHLLCVSWLQGEEWMIHRERGLHFPLHYGCTLMACKIPEYLFYTIKTSPETPFLPILNLYGRSLS